MALQNRSMRDCAFQKCWDAVGIWIQPNAQKDFWRGWLEQGLLLFAD